MSVFVRTTGGLLQLKPNRLSTSDFEAVRDFARECGVEMPQTSAPPSDHPGLTPLSISRKEPIDLLAQEPAIFK